MKKPVGLALSCAAACTPAAAGTGIVIHAGSWETRTTVASMQGGSMPVRRVCRPVDRTLDAAALTSIKSHPNTVCDQPMFNQLGTGASYAVTCAVGDLHIHMSGTITMLGPDAFSNHMISHAEKTGSPSRDMDMTSLTKRVGPCEPGEAQSRE